MIYIDCTILDHLAEVFGGDGEDTRCRKLPPSDVVSILLDVARVKCSRVALQTVNLVRRPLLFVGDSPVFRYDTGFLVERGLYRLGKYLAVVSAFKTPRTRILFSSSSVHIKILGAPRLYWRLDV